MGGVEISFCLLFRLSLYVCLVSGVFQFLFLAVFCLGVCVCLVLCHSILVVSSKRVQVHGNCYQNFVLFNFKVREFSSYSRGNFRLSYQFMFFCVIFLPISLRSLSSKAFTKL